MERRRCYLKTYVTRKVYLHSLIRTQLGLSNLSADRSLAKAWGLLPLGATVGGEVEKPVRCNWPPPLVKTSASSLDSQGIG